MTDRPTGMTDVKASVASLPGVGKAALACAALAVVLLLAPLWDLAEAIIGPRPSVPAIEEVIADKEKRATAFQGYAAQAKGRSLFYNPKAVAAAPPPTTDVATPTDTRPRSYGGPAIVAMIFDEVWFTDGKRLKVGGEEKDDLKVVAMQAPWSATLSWKGVEFPVNFFERNNVVFKDGVTTSVPKPEANTTETPAPEEPATGEKPAEPAKPASDPPATPEPAPTTPPASDPGKGTENEPKTPPATTPVQGNRNQA